MSLFSIASLRLSLSPFYFIRPWFSDWGADVPHSLWAQNNLFRNGVPLAFSVFIIMPLDALALVSLFGALAFVFFGGVFPSSCWGCHFTSLPPVDYCTSSSFAPPFVLLTVVPFRAPVCFCFHFFYLLLVLLLHHGKHHSHVVFFFFYPGGFFSYVVGAV